MHMNVRYFIYLHFIFGKFSQKKKHVVMCLEDFSKNENRSRLVRHDKMLLLLLMITFHNSRMLSIQTARAYLYGSHSVHILPLRILGSEIVQRGARQGQGIHSIFSSCTMCVCGDHFIIT